MSNNINSKSIIMVSLLGAISYLSGCAKSDFASKNSSDKKPSANTMRIGVSVPGGDGGFVETKDGGTVVVDSGKTDTPKGKLNCSLYMHRNGHHGCGPNGYHVWYVWIDNTLPVLQNSMTIPTELAAQAKTQGVYGYAKIAYLVLVRRPEG